MRAKESKDFSSEKREKSADFSAFKRIEFRLCLAKTKKHSRRSASVGAATQIRTGDLILTKDVLYQLSHSSVNRKDYSRDFLFCQALISKKTKIFSKVCITAKRPSGQAPKARREGRRRYIAQEWHCANIPFLQDGDANACGRRGRDFCREAVAE